VLVEEKGRVPSLLEEKVGPELKTTMVSLTTKHCFFLQKNPASSSIEKYSDDTKKHGFFHFPREGVGGRGRGGAIHKAIRTCQAAGLQHPFPTADPLVSESRFRSHKGKGGGCFKKSNATGVVERAPDGGPEGLVQGVLSPTLSLVSLYAKHRGTGVHVNEGGCGGN
jgi:hypothetical protein